LHQGKGWRIRHGQYIVEKGNRKILLNLFCGEVASLGDRGARQVAWVGGSLTLKLEGSQGEINNVRGKNRVLRYVDEERRKNVILKRYMEKKKERGPI